VPLALGAYIEAAGGLLLYPGLWFLGIVLALVLGALGTAASTFIVSEHYLGRSIATGQALRQSREYLGRLLALTLASGLVVGVGLILFIIPGIILFSGLIVGTPALVIENIRQSTDAMRRSWSLSVGYRRKLFVAYLLAFLLLLVPSLAITWISSAIGVEGGVVSPAGFGLRLIEALLQILTYPFLYVLTTLLYYDLRVRKEGFDLELLASTLQPAA